MIPRYEAKEISSIWTDHNKFATYLQVELAICKALEGTKIPEGTAQKIKEKAVINPERIKEIEDVVHHDIIAFCTSITENLDSSIGKFFHFGVTSSDIIDTATTLQIKSSLGPILGKLKELNETLLNKAQETKNIMTMGRSHGMYAEPLSFAQKFLGFYAESKRRLEDLQNFYDNELTGMLSGAVGNYTLLNPDIESKTLSELGLKTETLSTQVIPRDRIAKLISINGLMASFIERVAVEIRHLHRSEVSELHEGFAKNQKGSSTMPHKKNPISGENLTGIARVLRSHVSIALENCILWHERDISHSSAERLMLPDNLGLMYYALNRLNKTLQNLVLHEETIEQRVTTNFNYLSSYFLHFLIEHTDYKRDDLYQIVQEASFKAKTKDEFYEHLQNIVKDKGIECPKLPAVGTEDLKKIYMNYVDELVERCQK